MTRRQIPSRPATPVTRWVACAGILLFTLLGARGAGADEPGPASFEGDLARRAHLGFETAPDGEGGLFDAPRLAVRSVEPGSPAARSGLTAGDIIAAVNAERAHSAIHGFELLGNLPGETEASLEIVRGGESRAIRFTPPSEPLENLQGVHTTYGVLRMDDGTPLRTLLTKPLEAEDRLPAILLSDWTSCDTVEAPHGLERGWLHLVRGIVETTGMIVLRVDKPGCGDSLGFCSELDFDETVAYQKQALRQLKSRPDVDPENLFVFGESVGSYMAPLVARGEKVAGIFVYGGGGATWFERMLAFERKQRELSGRPLNAIDREMKRLVAFFHYYLVEALPLEEIFARDPTLREVWKKDVSHRSSTRHYGRPVRFHQQAQKHDFARAWIDAGAPALVLLGEFDQFESEEGARAIVNAVSRARPGDATLIVYPRMNHQLELYPSREAAFAGSDTPIVGAELVLADVRAWLQRVVSKE